MSYKKSEKGFTLIELSIVMVIIGLIVAGVVAGQSLVKQAQLRTIISEQEQVRVSLNSFNLEYSALPGDMNNADAYWSSATDACNAAGTGNLVSAECNGDGNKRISIVASNASEGYMAWKHLSLARLYPGTFVPTIALLGTVGSNIPASKFSGAGITLIYDDSSSDATAGDGAASGGREVGKNVILFGSAVSANIANGTFLSAAQAKSLDDKVDDGNPVMGQAVAVGVAAAAADGGTNCINTTTPATYNLDATDTAPCGIAFTF